MEEDGVFFWDDLDFLLLHFFEPLEFLDLVLGGSQFDIQLLDYTIFFLQQARVALSLELQLLFQLANFLPEFFTLLQQLLYLFL